MPIKKDTHFSGAFFKPNLPLALTQQARAAINKKDTHFNWAFIWPAWHQPPLATVLSALGHRRHVPFAQWPIGFASGQFLGRSHADSRFVRGRFRSNCPGRTNKKDTHFNCLNP